MHIRHEYWEFSNFVHYKAFQLNHKIVIGVSWTHATIEQRQKMVLSPPQSFVFYARALLVLSICIHDI